MLTMRVCACIHIKAEDVEKLADQWRFHPLKTTLTDLIKLSKNKVWEIGLDFGC